MAGMSAFLFNFFAVSCSLIDALPLLFLFYAAWQHRKYRCPACRAVYCSVPCYTVHRERICGGTPQAVAAGTATTTTTTASSSSSSAPTASRAPDSGVSVEGPTTYRVGDRALAALQHHAALRRALGDPRVQDTLRRIDSTVPDLARMAALERALDTDPAFAALMDSVLQAIGVRDVDGSCVLR